MKQHHEKDYKTKMVQRSEETEYNFKFIYIKVNICHNFFYFTSLKNVKKKHFHLEFKCFRIILKCTLIYFQVAVSK